MCKSSFCIIIDISEHSTAKNDAISYPITFNKIQKWIEDNHNIRVSKSSITMVKNKCDISELSFKAGKEPADNSIKTEKEKLVLAAFKAFGII